MPFFQWISATVAELYPPIIFLGAAVWLRPPRIPGTREDSSKQLPSLLSCWPRVALSVGSCWHASAD
jgi:hypothetical protein